MADDGHLGMTALSCVTLASAGLSVTISPYDRNANRRYCTTADMKTHPSHQRFQYNETCSTNPFNLHLIYSLTPDTQDDIAEMAYLRRTLLHTVKNSFVQMHARRHASPKNQRLHKTSNWLHCIVTVQHTMLMTTNAALMVIARRTRLKHYMADNPHYSVSPKNPP